MPPGHKSLSLVLSIAGAFAVLFLSFAPYTKKERVSGVVALPAGVVYLRAPSSGYVHQIHVSAGQQVKAGEPLLSVKADNATLRGSVAPQLLAQLDARRALAEAAVIDRRREYDESRAKLSSALDTLAVEVGQIDTQIGYQERLLDVLQVDLDRVASLLDDRYVSAMQASQAEAAVLDARAQLSVLQREKSRLEREINSVRGEVQEADTQWKLASATLEGHVLQIHAERIRDEVEFSPHVAAPVDGVVSEVSVKPGGSVAEGAMVVTLVPMDKKSQVELSVPSSAIGVARVGQSVNVRIDSYPQEKYGLFPGRISKISSTPVADFQVAQNDERGVVYRVYVEMDAPPQPQGQPPVRLLPGMQVQADLMLETRTLGQWMLAPVLETRARYQ